MANAFFLGFYNTFGRDSGIFFIGNIPFYFFVCSIFRSDGGFQFQSFFVLESRLFLVKFYFLYQNFFRGGGSRTSPGSSSGIFAGSGGGSYGAQFAEIQDAAGFTYTAKSLSGADALHQTLAAGNGGIR